MKTCRAVLYATCAGLALGAPEIGRAAPISVSNSWEIVTQIAANDMGKTPGEFIDVGADDVIPNGTGGTTGTATTINLATGFPFTTILGCSCGTTYCQISSAEGSPTILT